MAENKKEETPVKPTDKKISSFSEKEKNSRENNGEGDIIAFELGKEIQCPV